MHLPDSKSLKLHMSTPPATTSIEPSVKYLGQEPHYISVAQGRWAMKALSWEITTGRIKASDGEETEHLLY